MVNTKDNVINTDYIRIGEKTAFIKAADKLGKHRFVAIIAIAMLSLSITYVMLLNRFFMLLKSM